jgi:N-carbamoyl-L-amino-acid hydrolase
MTGSHLDTVPGAGYLDGALGVVAGLECLRRLEEQGVQTQRALECVAFSDEEGRFGGMFGSQAISGQLTPGAILSARDLDGLTLVEAMKSRGFDAQRALRARRSRSTLSAFVELHIEQGPVLDRKGMSVGVVEGIFGLFRWKARLIGTANHAGTTPMDMRNDAFLGLAEFSGATRRILEENGGPQSVATIGRVELLPGAANVIPGQVEFTLEVRDLDRQVLLDLQQAFRRALSATARRHGLMFEFDVLTEFDPVQCDTAVTDTIEQVSAALGVDYMRLPSGAAHDTQMMAQATRAGMVFVPSKDGRSHSPAEWSSWKAIERGANVLLHTLLRLAG